MNYRLLSTLAFVASMYTVAQANHPSKVIEQPQVAPSRLAVAYVDVAYVLENLPEAKKNRTEIQSFEVQLTNQIQTKFKEYQEKVEVYREQVNTLSEVQRKQKEIELQNLGRAIQELEEQRPAKMTEKYKTVMQPLHDKMQEVINKIKAEQKYNLILNKSTDVGPVVLAADESFNISDLVLAQLKAMEPKAPQQPVIGPKDQPKAKTVPAKPGKKK
ncbi:OmpH family outer membrane protein [Cardinium endosymbiont of Philonthus spinipes]|uniref:OmpH family outer membrane protein n=1 Tax=Cardinium endosymbiont of Philonthus spinipes TaxID=3077941 RepID=UPI00313E572D